jgi:hypothetical protein
MEPYRPRWWCVVAEKARRRASGAPAAARAPTSTKPATPARAGPTSLNDQVLQLQSTAGNRAVTMAIQRDASRDELLAAYNQAVEKKDWAQVALRLNGFSGDDVKMLARKLDHWQRVTVVAAVRSFMAGWPAHVIPAVVEVDPKADGAGAALASDVPGLRSDRMALEGVKGGGEAKLASGPVTVDEATRRQKLSDIRHRLMKIVADLHDTMPKQADESAEQGIASQEAVALGELRQAELKPEFEHPDQAVQDKVLAALQLQVKYRALESVGDPAAEEKYKLLDPKGKKVAWCGEFAYRKAREAGLDPGRMAAGTDLSRNHTHVDMLELAFTYQTEQAWIFDREKGDWDDVQHYHRDVRHSPRQYKIMPAADKKNLIDPLAKDPTYANWWEKQKLDAYYAVALTPRPGDIVLKDNLGNVRPDHITTVTSADASGTKIRTVGGNEGSGTSAVKTSAQDIDLASNPEPTAAKGAERVYAIGRWSIVDFETHYYGFGKEKPKSKPL